MQTHLLAYGELEWLSIRDGRELERGGRMPNKVGRFAHGAGWVGVEWQGALVAR